LPQFEQTDTPSKIDVTVYGVEPIWTIACFLAEKIGQIAHNNSDYLGVLSRLNKIFINWIVCPGCYALRSFAATVIIRLTNRIVHIAKRNGLPVTLEILGVTKEKLDRIGNITCSVLNFLTKAFRDAGQSYRAAESTTKDISTSLH
jgi:hypothetical protein